VDDHDVIGSQLPREFVGVALVHGLVEGAIVAPEPRVTLAMDQVVQSLGQPEELHLIGVHDDPAGRHPQFLQDRTHLGQHLGDTAPSRGGIDHPDRTALELGNQHRRFDP
jgi:hypothetical protein